MTFLGFRSLPIVTTTFLLPMLLASAPDDAPRRAEPPAAPRQSSQWAQVMIEQRIIIRIPTVPGRTVTRSSMTTDAPPPPPIRWKETKGPKCLPLNRIRGASITMLNGVTMLTERNEAFRTHFERACRSADFYAGFYIQPNKDGALCAGRDLLHARNGSTCEIEKFSKLVAEQAGEDEDDK